MPRNAKKNKSRMKEFNATKKEILGVVREMRARGYKTSDSAARAIRKGPSKDISPGGVVQSVPGAKTPMGRALEWRNQFYNLQDAKRALYRAGRVVSPRVDAVDIAHGISTIKVVSKGGLAGVKTVKVVSKPSAWNNPLGFGKYPSKRPEKIR